MKTPGFKSHHEKKIREIIEAKLPYLRSWLTCYLCIRREKLSTAQIEHVAEKTLLHNYQQERVACLQFFQIQQRDFLKLFQFKALNLGYTLTSIGINT
jgi:hypothetical protein